MAGKLAAGCFGGKLWAGNFVENGGMSESLAPVSLSRYITKYVVRATSAFLCDPTDGVSKSRSRYRNYPGGSI